MLRSWNPKYIWPAGIGIAILLLVFGLSITSPVDVLRERSFDGLLGTGGLLGNGGAASSIAAGSNVVVVDIDSASLERLGDWPWSRDRLAELVERIADGRPKALGIDILLLGEDERSARAFARRLASTTSDEPIARLATSLAAQLPDTDRRLADALRRVPTALSLGLDDDPKAEAPPPAPMILGSRLDLSAQWHVESAIGSRPLIAEAAQGHGVLLLPLDADERVRRAPLVVATSTHPRPGLALEVLTIHQIFTSLSD